MRQSSHNRELQSLTSDESLSIKSVFKYILKSIRFCIHLQRKDNAANIYCMEKKNKHFLFVFVGHTLKFNGVQSSFYTGVLRNIFFCGLEQHEDK